MCMVLTVSNCVQLLASKEVTCCMDWLRYYLLEEYDDKQGVVLDLKLPSTRKLLAMESARNFSKAFTGLSVRYVVAYSIFGIQNVDVLPSGMIPRIICVEAVFF